MRLLSVLLCAAMLIGCEREERKNVYKPGGEYSQLLDARGRRHVVRNAKGEVLAKIRVRDEALKVYAADMRPLGEVELRDGAVIVTPRAGEPIAFDESADAIELSDRMRIEPVEHGWAVFDADGRRLGYFGWHDDGRLALRDDYSAAPRIFASLEDAEARTPAGKAELETVPAFSAAKMLPFALDGAIDELDRVALGMWLVQNQPDEDARPTEEPRPADAGSVSD